MMKKREFVKSGLALSVLAGGGFPVLAAAKVENFTPKRIHMPQTVRAPARYPKGTIIVDRHKRFLYLLHGNGRARRYGVGIGRAALSWAGIATIERKEEWPSWTPTKDMIRRDPDKYAQYAKGVPGGRNNPLGARALYLFDNGVDTLYRIHGTNAPWTIGTASSNGCIRMINEHVVDLYKRVPFGAKVEVF